MLKESFAHLGKTILCHLFYGYLKLLEKTVNVKIENRDAYSWNHIVGFWHEDSFTMNLLLGMMSESDPNINVICTADSRGDYIQYMLEKNGGSAIRMTDGFGSKPFMRGLLQKVKVCGQTVASAMDGPTGPRHVPKKLLFFLSETGEKEFISVCFNYSHKLSLKGRWDHYVIPLPFTTISIELTNYGVVSKKQIPSNLPFASAQKYSIMSEDMLLIHQAAAVKSR